MAGVHRDKDALARSTAELPRPPKTDKGKAPAASKQPKDKVITYALDENRVYVAVASSLDEAIDRAYEVYPNELASIPREQIALSVAVRVKDKNAQVTVSRSAWHAIAAELRQFEIVYINILDKPRSPRPDLKVMMEGVDGEPPSYESGPPREVGQFLAVDEKQGSRTPSPSPSLGNRIKGWFKGDDSKGDDSD